MRHFLPNPLRQHEIFLLMRQLDFSNDNAVENTVIDVNTPDVRGTWHYEAGFAAYPFFAQIRQHGFSIYESYWVFIL
jgi:hypothetical protein